MSRSTVGTLPAESLAMSELDRQAQEAARLFAIAAARREQAASEAYHLRADDRRGARVTSGELAAICAAVAVQTLRGFKVEPLDFSDLRSALMAESLHKATAERTIRHTCSPLERAHLPIVERIWHAPTGTASADRRLRLLEAEAFRMEAGIEDMPRIGNLADSDVNLSWLHQRARSICLKARRGGVTGDDHNVILSAATDPAKMPRKVARLPRWNADLSGDDLANIVGANRDERAALRQAIDGQALADLAVDYGWTLGTAKVAVKRGRRSLRDSLDLRDLDDRLHAPDSDDAQTQAWQRICAAIAQQRDGRPGSREGTRCIRWNVQRGHIGHRIRVERRRVALSLNARENARKAPRPSHLAVVSDWTPLGTPIVAIVEPKPRKRTGKAAKVATGPWQTVSNPDAHALAAYQRGTVKRAAVVRTARRLTGRAS